MSLERKEVDGEEVFTTGKDSKDYLRILNKARYRGVVMMGWGCGYCGDGCGYCGMGVWLLWQWVVSLGGGGGGGR